MSTFFQNIYNDPNIIKFKVKHIGGNDIEYSIFRYNWDNYNENYSFHKDKIIKEFTNLSNRQKETIDIYIQYSILQPHHIDIGTKLIDDYYIEKIKEKCIKGVKRIRISNSEKYLNPMTNNIEYKLEDGNYVETSEKVKPLTNLKIDIDLLKILDDEKFIKDCLPKENRNRKINKLLNEKKIEEETN